jgi:GT2 family glycosyltransferase
VVISVVIVTYNNHAEIGACLDALHLALAPYTSHLCLIDNASTDSTVQVLTAARRSLAHSFSQFLIIENRDNQGFTAAVNQGLERSTGDFVLILNPDVIIPAAAMPVLLQQFTPNSSIGVVAPQLRFPDGSIQPSCRRFPRKLDLVLEASGLVFLARRLGYRDWKMAEFAHRRSRFVEQPQGAFLLARKAVLESVGRLDERFFMFFSDVDWCERVIAAGWRIWFCADTFVYHHKGASVYRSRTAMLVTSHRSFADYFAKHDRTLFERIGTKVVSLLLLMTLELRLLMAFDSFSPASRRGRKYEIEQPVPQTEPIETAKKRKL